MLFHWLGGLAAGSFYVPFRRVQGWSWETYWLVGGLFSWIIAPWSLALALTNDLIACLGAAPVSTLVWCYAFGVLWGVGGLTFGLAVRYLGLSLGVAVALGYCALFGTLLPPLVGGEFVQTVLGTSSGLVILAGMGVCMAGIALTGMAGVAKERQLGAGQRQEAVPELALRKEWFGHDPTRFEEFRRRYIEELRAQRPCLTALRRRARDGMVTLVYSAHDTEHNDAVVLAEVLRRGLRKTR